MSDYVFLMKMTDDAAASVGDLPAYVAAIKAAWTAQAGTELTLFVTMGEYDAVAFGSGTEEQAAAFSLHLSREDLMRTVTMRAFTAEEIGAVLDTVSKFGVILPGRRPYIHE